MKKFAIILIIATLALSLTACTSDSNEDNTSDTSLQNENSLDNGSIIVNENTTSYYGKISNIVGNQITLSIANLPSFEGVTDENTGNSVIIGDGGIVSDEYVAGMLGEGGDSSGPVAQAVPDDVVPEVVVIEDEVGFEPELSLEYTGEEKDFTIPAGANISNGMGGQISSDDLTKGYIIEVVVNNETGIVTQVYVWSQK